MLVFVDALSRLRAHFKLPETMKFFKEKDHIEFFRHHSIYPRTIENGILFMHGLTKNDITNNPDLLKKSRIISHLWKIEYLLLWISLNHKVSSLAIRQIYASQLSLHKIISMLNVFKTMQPIMKA